MLNGVASQVDAHTGVKCSEETEAAAAVHKQTNKQTDKQTTNQRTSEASWLQGYSP